MIESAHRRIASAPIKRRAAQSGFALLPAGRAGTFALWGLVLAACGADAPGALYELSGRVAGQHTEGAATTPIGDALVRFTSDTGHVSETRTDSEGRYAMQVFSDVAFGQVRAEAAGFAPSEATVYFDQPQRRIDLVLRRLPAE